MSRLKRDLRRKETCNDHSRFRFPFWWLSRVSFVLSCRSFFAKEPLITGLFCGKRPVSIRHPMCFRRPLTPATTRHFLSWEPQTSQISISIQPNCINDFTEDVSDFHRYPLLAPPSRTDTFRWIRISIPMTVSSLVISILSHNSTNSKCHEH